MQTFLPVPDFKQSAKLLDYRRLGKQRVEAYQILNVLQSKPNTKVGWTNHPAVKMWRGYAEGLTLYMNECIMEWKARGYKNTMQLGHIEQIETVKIPKWLGLKEFHASHRSNLLRKDPTFYGQYGWTEPDSLEYVWPINY